MKTPPELFTQANNYAIWKQGEMEGHIRTVLGQAHDHFAKNEPERWSGQHIQQLSEQLSELSPAALDYLAQANEETPGWPNTL